MWCYCGSAQAFASCCQPFLMGAALPQTALQLMRSRYSAYCSGHIQYIKNTYHPSQQSDQATAEIAAFASSAHFIALSVLPISDKSLLQQRMPHNNYLAAQYGTLSPATLASATTAAVAEASIDYVHFIARFIMQDKLQQLEEQSRFIFEQQQWWYLDGRLFSHANQKINRNDACPCGSGKKYKVCRPHLMSAQQT